MGQRLCHRFGPGRLPFARRRDVGGGIAMAATGLLAAAIWFGGTGLLTVAGVGGDAVGFLLGVGLLFLPTAVPTSFIVGTLLWRFAYPPDDQERYGALFGMSTALASLAIGAASLALFLGASNVHSGEMALAEAAVFAGLMLPVSFLFAVVAAGWLVLPLGVFGGWYHERAKARS